MKTSILKINGGISLESGAELPDVQIAYNTYGLLTPDSKVVWVTHALTANSDVYDWWKGLFGTTDLFNERDYFIVCANVLGSHYGSTSPLHENPETGEPYYHSFPEFTIRDIVQLHIRLADHLGISKIHLLLGGSMGGHQALEWAIIQPNRIENLSLIATSAVHSPWGVAFNESQRLAIANDPSWKYKVDDAGLNGMKTARSLALLSYRNYQAYNKTQQPSDEELIFPDRAASYQRYQGEKLARRFNAFSYWYLSKAMDSQNVGRGRGGVDAALKKVKARTLVITIEEDLLFPLSDQLVLVKGISNASHEFVASEYGHDGFLIETDSLSKLLADFLETTVTTEKWLRVN